MAGDGVILASIDECDRKIVSVEYPGYVGDLGAALNRLGGIAALSKRAERLHLSV